jgi:hypothetical protein
VLHPWWLGGCDQSTCSMLDNWGRWPHTRQPGWWGEMFDPWWAKQVLDPLWLGRSVHMFHASDWERWSQTQRWEEVFNPWWVEELLDPRRFGQSKGGDQSICSMLAIGGGDHRLSNDSGWRTIEEVVMAKWEKSSPHQKLAPCGVSLVGNLFRSSMLEAVIFFGP